MKKILTLITFITITVSTYAQHKPGTLDSSFGTNGISILNSIDVYSDCNDAAPQSTGKIICVGAGQVTRFTTNGFIDTTFGKKGMSIPVVFGKNQDSLYGNGDDTLIQLNTIVIQANDKILVAGYMATGDMFNPQYDMVIMRLTADGSIDSSFGNNGGIIADYSKGDFVGDIQIQPDGKILLFGTSGSHFNLLQYLPDGMLDENFGNNGSVLEPSITAQGSAIALQSNGKIAAVGYYENKITLVQYLPDGTRNNEFGNKGKVVSAIEGEYVLINDLLMQPDGKIIIAGSTNNFITYNLLLARYNIDGSFDESFGEHGISAPELIYGAKATRLSLQKDGKLIVTGCTMGGGVYQKYMLVRLLTTGNLDVSFASNGQQFTNISTNSIDVANGLILTHNNKIILAGTSSINGYPYVSLAQYYNDDSIPPPTPIARIKRWLRKHGITWEDCPPSICDKITGYAVQRSSNGVNWATVFSSRRTANNQQSTANNYADPSPLRGTNYYRLQTTSVDGAVTYSNVIAITHEPLSISLSPNPARSVLQITGLSASGKTKIMVADLSGNVAISKQLSTASSAYSLNIVSLKPGNYMLRIESDGGVVTKQFVKE